ncbi:MAG: hypothetical protein H5T68_09805 [Chloroflexi bacterium]|nr:hypothetical protein [Chloroflexota bacterium]
MGEPERPEDFVRLEADDLAIYLSKGIWENLKPRQTKLLVAVSGYGRFWIYLEPTATRKE